MRKILKQNNKIELMHLSSGGKEVFKINSLIGEGGACVVYSATRNNRKGLLKEFYPADFKESYNILKRTNKNQLVASGDAYIERFNKMCQEFKEGYDLLEKINFASTNNLISNYVPEYEIYAGTDKNSTIYIWTRQNTGVTLKSYILEVWKNPKTQTEFKLYNLLTIIKSIALGVCGMHIQGLMHRDIKPDNFLIAKDGMNNINPYQVSMFDVNSFCYGTSSKYIVGTEGYAAPEVKKGQTRYYSDIYSLGAVIFSSVVRNDNGFHIQQYSNLENLIDESELLSNISDIYIKAQLLDVLKKSLAEHPVNRYQETEIFISDLDKIIVRLLPNTTAKKITDSNQRLKIIEERKPIDAIPIFQDLFYKHPVFRWFPETNEINILIIGGGLYGQAFLDVALTTLQLKDKNLNVTVVTESPNYDKSIYLKIRPDLERFFDIDKKNNEKDGTSYGCINFIQGKFSSKAHSNDELIRRMLTETKPCYVLVSLGDDSLNNAVAKSIVDTDISALVNFVWSGNEKNFKKGNPVYINQSIEYKNINKDLLRMAFNTHLIWSDSIDADIDMLYNDFKKSYNFKNSIAFALSVQYKLYSTGLTLDEVQNDLKKVCFDTDNAEQINFLRELSWVEHRRWVTDKITSGWRAPLNPGGDVDTSLCLQFGGTKDKKKKLHLCIVKSTNNVVLDKTNWDSCDVENLDPLDRISVEMYRLTGKKNDYKLIDEELVKNMAYIISYRSRPNMAAFFNDGRHFDYANKELFKNVATSMLIIPKSLKYLYYYDAATSLPELLNAMNGTLTFFQKKNMKHNTKFIFVFSQKAPVEAKEKLNEISHLYNVKIMFHENIGSANNATQLFLQECKNDYLIDGSSLPFCDKDENSYCIEQIKKMQYFEYDIDENKILNTTCPYLNYLNTDRSKLTVSDLFMLKNVSFTFSNPDVSMFYKKLWEIYIKNISKENILENSAKIWNSLSDKLNNYSKANDIVASFVCNNYTGEIEYLEKIMPAFCYENCKSITNTLMENNILISKDVCVLNKDSFKINISYDRNFAEIPVLFSNYDALSKKIEIVRIKSNGTEIIKIFYDNIFVNSSILNDFEYTCLQQLADAKFINDLTIIDKINNGYELTYCVNFCYASESVKKMLCTKDEVLKTYVYYSLIYNSNFDDVKANVTVNEEGETNKFDLILTKGNKSIFIQFNNEKETEQYYIQNILKSVNFYGVNSKVIFVTDDFGAEISQHGESHNIISVSVSENINDIIIKRLGNI